MIEEVNETRFTLVLKVESPVSLSDYKPITCCNVLYKCTMKNITSRMKLFIDEAMSPNQFAFVPGRHIQDNVL